MNCAIYRCHQGGLLPPWVPLTNLTSPLVFGMHNQFNKRFTSGSLGWANCQNKSGNVKKQKW